MVVLTQDYTSRVENMPDSAMNDVEAWKRKFAEMIEQRSVNVDAGNFYKAEEARAKLSERKLNRRNEQTARC